MHTLKKPLRNVAREKPKLTTTPGNDNGHKTTQTPSPQDKPRHPHQSLTGASAPPASPPHLSPHHRLEEPTEPAGLSAEEHPSLDTSTPSQDCRPTPHHLTNPSHPAAVATTQETHPTTHPANSTTTPPTLGSTGDEPAPHPPHHSTTQPQPTTHTINRESTAPT